MNVMWKNFMTAIGLLAVAMMAALYSSGAAREGHVLGGAISAVLALSIAVWVGVKFVPRLASHVDWDWLPFFSRYHITREGWIYFGGVAIVVFAAINTSNNLLYMVVSALLAVLVLSGSLSALNFRFVQPVIRIPSRCYAGEPFPITIQVHNNKRLFPTFSMCFEPGENSAFSFSSFYIPLIRGMEHVSQTGQAMLLRRGHYSVGKVKASSRYPFGFFLKTRHYPAGTECICYPEILPKEQISAAGIDFRGWRQRFQRGLSQDLYMIRDYLPSDTARHVHWKASAKAAALKTREYAAEESRRINLVFDRFGHPDDSESFEHLVSYAASLAYHLINDGIDVNFVTDEWEGGAIESILEYLALVEMSDSAGLPADDDAAFRLSLRRNR